MIKIYFFIALLLLPMGVLRADELEKIDQKINKQEKELQQLEKKIFSGHQRLKELNVQQKQAFTRINENRSEFESMSSQTMKTEKLLKGTTAQFKELSREVLLTEKKYERCKASFHKRLVHFFKNRNNPFLKILMASQSIGDLDRRLHYYNAIIESDSGNYNELRKHRTALKKQTKEMDSKRKELTLLNQQMIKEKNSLLAKIQSDKEFLQKIHEEQTLLEQRAGQLRKSSQYLQDKIQNLTSAREQIRKDAQEGKSTSIIPTGKKILPGTLSWPIKGKFRTERPFGKIKSGMATIFNPGLDLTTEGDISVYASEDGIIFYKGTPAGSSSTYGKVVMIAHGDYDGKFITLYGNLSTILVALNQTVKKGEKIATIAAKDYLGSPSTPRLHYQVRVNGEPKDPAQWLEKR